MQLSFFFSRLFSLILVAFLSLAINSCGTTTKILSTDPDTMDDIKSASDNRIARIMLNDSTAEFGSSIVMNPSKTEWTTASVVRREFNEINFFHAFDSWKFTEGDATHTAIPTNMIKSITIPADGFWTGAIIGGVIGTGLAIGLYSILHTNTSNAGLGDYAIYVDAVNIIELLVLPFGGAALGGQAGATHQTMYTR
jgi:hypothetical protein